MYSLKFYKGDDKIKSFIWDLVSSGEMKNHTGLSAPVPRGRKSRKAKGDTPTPEEQTPVSVDFSSLDFDPDMVLPDDGYRRHLERHSNK